MIRFLVLDMEGGILLDGHSWVWWGLFYGGGGRKCQRVVAADGLDDPRQLRGLEVGAVEAHEEAHPQIVRALGLQAREDDLAGCLEHVGAHPDALLTAALHEHVAVYLLDFRGGVSHGRTFSIKSVRPSLFPQPSTYPQSRLPT